MSIELPPPKVRLQLPWTLYAKQLFPQGYGHPLWRPDPDPTAAREVDIGDVGWMAYGGFLQLFNSIREVGERQVYVDVPEDFVPLNAPNLVVLGPAESVTAIPPLCSGTIETFGASGSVQGNSGIGLASVGASFSFKCTDNEGAVLTFSPAAYSTEIMSKQHVINYMRENFPHWMAFSDKYGLGLEEDDIFFVSEVTKTSRWAVAAFQGDCRMKEGTFSADLGSAGGLDVSVSISNQSLPQTHRKVGPRRPRENALDDVGSAATSNVVEPNDQCIFIHYYQMKRRMGLFRTIRAAAGPHQLPPSGPDEEELGVLVEGHTEETMEETYNPVKHLLDYILQNSDASMAIASDLDVYALFKQQTIPEDISEALVRLRPTVEVDQNLTGTVVVQSDFQMRTAGEVSGNAQGIIDSADPLVEDSPIEESNNYCHVPANIRRSSSASSVLLSTRAPHYSLSYYRRSPPYNDAPDPDGHDAYSKDYHSDNDDDTNSDTSDAVVEISADEYPGYFQERDGRLFHSHSRSPYPLPVDAEEHVRQNGLNGLLTGLIGGSSVGPVQELLMDASGEQRRVLDLGTGTGEWVLDMAREFPRVRFYGVDIVPIATRYPPSNVHFEVHDIAEKFRYDSASIDLVHARSISMAICDYGALLPEIARVLRPGGLFVSNEWARSPIMLDGSDLNVRAPSTAEFYRAVGDTLRERRGLLPVAHKIPDLLRDSGHFADIVSRPFFMPIGGWGDNPALRELGREYREMVELYARAMRDVLIEGPWAARADALIQGHIDESWRVCGLASVYHTVHARCL